MRGINVRKIAAFAGAAILGLSAVAIADVYYGNTQLVDQNGQPTVKVYVGTKAAISDGVAAANIAAKIANEAYKSSVLTATVGGTPTCTVGAGTGTSGTCSIVESSKKVTLEVTVPGQIAGTHSFKTLITDTIDKTLQNRNNTRSEDNYTTGSTAPDTSTTSTAEPTPLRMSGLGTQVVSNLYRIGSDRFNNFADVPLADAQANGFSYTEQQAFWIGTGANAVAYDPGSSYRDVVVNKYNVLAYSAKFTGNDYGIPVCTGELNSTVSDDWTSCVSTSNSRTAKHRLKINFMGSEWIISEMGDPDVSISNNYAVNNGGQIKLAKEAKYGIINVGEVLDAGVFKVRLSDISVATGGDNAHPAIIDILDANDAVVGQVQVGADSTYTFSQSGTANLVKIHVYKTAPGFTLNAKWAEMAIYTDEITLKDGGRYNLASSGSKDYNFWVNLLWKNRDYTGSSGGNSSKADSLRQIVIYNYDDYTDKMASGVVKNFLASTPTYKLTYKGVDLSDADYQQLSISALSPQDRRVATATGDAQCGATTSADWNYASAKWIQIRTNGESLMGGSGSNLVATGITVESVYFDPIGIVNLNPTAMVNVTDVAANTTHSLPSGLVFVPGINTFLNTTNITAATAVTVNTATSFTVTSTGAALGGGYVGIPAAALYNTTSLNGTFVQNSTPSYWQPKIFWQAAGKNCFNWNSVTYVGSPYGAPADSNAVRFEKAGENTQALGGIFFGNSTAVALVGDGTLGNTFQGLIGIKEDAGYSGIQSNNLVYMSIPFIANGSSSTSGTNAYRFRASDSSTQNAYYYGLQSSTTATWTASDPVIVTERGSKITSLGSNDAKIMVAKRLGMPTFEFAMADTSAATSANEYILGVGDQQVFGGVTVKVKAIDANAGSCSVVGPGGKPACSVDSASLTAVISPDNKGSVEVSQPFALSSKLVGMDTEGAGTGVAILVGGPLVNTMTADTLKDTTVNLQTDGPVVKEFGSKIVVAGYTAADTVAAADTFIAGITRK